MRFAATDVALERRALGGGGAAEPLDVGVGGLAGDVAAVSANDVWAVGSRSDLVLSPAPAFTAGRCCCTSTGPDG